MKRLPGIFTVFFFVGCIGSNKKKGPPDDESLFSLKKSVYSPGLWVTVFAIEFLRDLGYQNEALQYSDEQLASFDSIPQKRIGFWR